MFRGSSSQSRFRTVCKIFAHGNLADVAYQFAHNHSPYQRRHRSHPCNEASAKRTTNKLRTTLHTLGDRLRTACSRSSTGEGSHRPSEGLLAPELLTPETLADRRSLTADCEALSAGAG